jgi:hypothetical protein
MRVHRSSNLNAFFRDRLCDLGIPEVDVPVAPHHVGMSAGTGPKEFEFWRLNDVIASIAANINLGRRRRSHYPFNWRVLDLTSGPGAYFWKPEGQPAQLLIGTSLLLPYAAHKHGLNYRVGLCEREPILAKHLEARLATMAAAGRIDLARVDVLRGDFANTAHAWLQSHVQQRRSQGLVIVDANGALHYDALAALMAEPQARMLDVLINYQGVQYHWPERRPTTVPPPIVDDVMALCRKDKWQIGHPRTNYLWTWMYGSNNPSMRLIKELDFIWRDTPAGQSRLDRFRLTRAERRARNQPALDLGA